MCAFTRKLAGFARLTQDVPGLYNFMYSPSKNIFWGVIEFNTWYNTKIQNTIAILPFMKIKHGYLLLEPFAKCEVYRISGYNPESRLERIIMKSNGLYKERKYIYKAYKLPLPDGIYLVANKPTKAQRKRAKKYRRTYKKAYVCLQFSKGFMRRITYRTVYKMVLGLGWGKLLEDYHKDLPIECFDEALPFDVTEQQHPD